jgi:hypothetical protein
MTVQALPSQPSQSKLICLAFLEMSLLMMSTCFYSNVEHGSAHSNGRAARELLLTMMRAQKQNKNASKPHDDRRQSMVQSY